MAPRHCGFAHLIFVFGEKTSELHRLTTFYKNFAYASSLPHLNFKKFSLKAFVAELSTTSLEICAAEKMVVFSLIFSKPMNHKMHVRAPELAGNRCFWRLNSSFLHVFLEAFSSRAPAALIVTYVKIT